MQQKFEPGNDLRVLHNSKMFNSSEGVYEGVQKAFGQTLVITLCPLLNHTHFLINLKPIITQSHYAASSVRN